MNNDKQEIIDMSDPENLQPSVTENNDYQPMQNEEGPYQPMGKQNKKPLPHKRIINWHRNLSKKQKLLVMVTVILLIGAACYGAYRVLQDSEKPSASVQTIQKPKTVPSKLTGLQVAPEVNERQVTGVMIENSFDARPQSGLLEAGLVFEAIAEGGITRFLALYQDTTANNIGPVRSVRPYYLDFAAPFDASIAHVGGSPEALSQINGMKDLDYSVNSGSYERIRERPSPHNVYTNSAKLDELESKKGYTKSNFTGFEHAKKEEKSANITARVINLTISSPLFNVQYAYDATTNSYKRAMGGTPHTDEKTGTQLSPKAVIVIETSRSQNGVYSVYGMTGSGKVSIYQNGTVLSGTWTKSDRKSQYVFKDDKGENLKLVPGQAWVTLVTPGGVTHAP